MSTKNYKQQKHVAAASMSSSATAYPVRLLLCAILLGLGVVATLLLMSSSSTSSALLFFFPPPAADRPQLPPPPHLPERSPSTLPPVVVVDAGIHSSTTVQRAAAGASREEEQQQPVDDDEELMALAAAAPREAAARAPGKVAFMFLAKWGLPMAELWDKFFDGHAGLYSVYVHTDPAFNGSDHDQASAFYRRRIPSKEVRWGHVSMVEAERRLLANALLDGSNARFVLLSESHVPLFDFPTVYSYLLNSTAAAFVESYDQPGATGRGRYKRGMAPAIAAAQWRKGSQWFELDRALAAEVVADAVYLPVFKRLCKRNCYADEHYLPTFLNIRHPAAAANRSLTWVDWSRGGPHPSRFSRTEVTVDFLRWLRTGTTCEYNGRSTTVCFLFARKFLPNSLTRFLRFAPKVMGFG